MNDIRMVEETEVPGKTQENTVSGKTKKKLSEGEDLVVNREQQKRAVATPNLS